MNLREFATNSQVLNNKIENSDKDGSKKLKVLGILWDTESDTLQMGSPKFTPNAQITKRHVMSVVHSVYDPLGILSPLTLQAKVFLQELWRKKIDWAEALCDEDVQTWRKLEADLTQTNQVVFNRYIDVDQRKPVQLHCFVDSSSKAMLVLCKHQTRRRKFKHTCCVRKADWHLSNC